MKLALVLLTLFSYVASADEIDDRTRRNAERQAEESRQQTANYRAKSNQERLIAFNGFVANHGGLRSGTCQVATEDCSRRSSYYRESSYCPLDNVTQADITGLGASGEYVVRDCRVVTGDNSACVLSYDSEQSSYPDKTNYKATCTPEGGAPYLLSFNASGREFRPAPVKQPKPEKETYTYRSSYPSYYGYGYGYYGYGRGYYGSRVNNYNCYGEQCNYYGVGKAKKKRSRK